MVDEKKYLRDQVEEQLLNIESHPIFLRCERVRNAIETTCFRTMFTSLFLGFLFGGSTMKNGQGSDLLGLLVFISISFLGLLVFVVGSFASSTYVRLQRKLINKEFWETFNHLQDVYNLSSSTPVPVFWAINYKFRSEVGGRLGRIESVFR